MLTRKCFWQWAKQRLSWRSIFYSKNFSLSCKRSNGTRWTNRFSVYINSEYVYALENSKEHVTLVIGYLTKDKKQLKMRGIKKWLPGNDLDTYEFVSNLKKDIITTLETKIWGINKRGRNCFITTKSGWGIPTLPYDDPSLSNAKEKRELQVQLKY